MVTTTRGEVEFASPGSVASIPRVDPDSPPPGSVISILRVDPDPRPERLGFAQSFSRSEEDAAMQAFCVLSI